MTALVDTVDQLIGKIVTIRSNPHYRIGDVFYAKGLRFQDSADHVLALPEFKGTILQTYLARNGGIYPQNLFLLNDVIREITAVRNYRVPEPDETVAHVRAGDAVELDWFLSEDLFQRMASAEGKRLSIVICFQFAEFPKMNWWMFSEEKLAENITRFRTFLTRLIEARPDLAIDIRSSPDIDSDLVYMIGATRFVRDKGGFSDLICDLRTLRAQQAF